MMREYSPLAVVAGLTFLLAERFLQMNAGCMTDSGTFSRGVFRDFGMTLRSSRDPWGNSKPKFGSLDEHCI